MALGGIRLAPCALVGILVVKMAGCPPGLVDKIGLSWKAMGQRITRGSREV